MFRLQRLRLTDFRGFEALDMTFEPDLTVLVGANGSGKSSVLHALTRIVGANGLTQRQQALDVRAGAAVARVTLDVEMDRSRTITASIRPGVDGLVRVEGGGLGLKGAPPFLVYSTNRAATDKTPGSTAGESWGVKHATEAWADAGASYERFFHWFRETEDLENEAIRDGGEPPKELVAARAAVERVLGVSELRVRRRFEPYSTRPILTVQKEGVVLPFDALSEGERALVALVADIARRLSHADPARGPDTQAVILIDEIELHLHPTWQRQILRQLRSVFPNVQWITTTHSPLVASELEPRHLRVLQDFSLRDISHGRGREIDAILREVFETAARPSDVVDRFDRLVDAIDDARVDRARELLAELEASVGEHDSDIVYYRAILQRLAS